MQRPRAEGGCHERLHVGFLEHLRHRAGGRSRSPACAWLLWATGRVKVSAPKGAATNAQRDAEQVDVTGHVWDGDLQEYNNPLPKWWSNLFWLTIVFGIVYLVLYPGLGTFPGVLGWTSSGAYKAETTDFDARVQPLYDKYAAMDIPQIAADPAARQTGERLFLTYCSPCHGSDAGGGKGFPNLRDHDWLYGGEPANIVDDDHRRTHGRHARLRPDARRGRRARRGGVRALAVRACRTTRCRRSSASRYSRRTARHAMARTARATRRSARRT